jgi:preprotein translocase subunit SecE
MRGFTNYIKNSIAEMQKVVWPTRKQAIQLTILIIVVSLVIGLALSALDAGWRTALKTLILRIP